jgi:putative oxidoreductase
LAIVLALYEEMKRTFKTGNNQQHLDIWLLAIRIAIAAFMLTHGLPKFLNLMHGNYAFADPIGIGEKASLLLVVFAEVICSTFILIGLGTRLATIPLIITMLIAAVIVHGNDPFAKKELALLYLLVFISLLILGSGRYSIDFLLTDKSKTII